MKKYAALYKVISIHALVKRATNYALHGSNTLGISIHALVKRATDEWETKYNAEHISIHALVKRATPTGARKLRATFDFNPRPREEGDKAPLRVGEVD